MNANELINDIAKISDGIDALDWIKKARPMLRFQQEEINALREQVQYLQTQVYGGTTK
jgi:hypothetical protein